MTDDEIFSRLDRDDVQLIVALANADMNVSKVAREGFFSWDGAKYHFEKIYKRTQLNPRNFYDLAKLVGVIENARHS